jgi:hypothetical protein
MVYLINEVPCKLKLIILTLVHWVSAIGLIRAAAIWHRGVGSAHNRNEYQKKGPPTHQSRQPHCPGSLDVSQPYRPPETVTGMALPFLPSMVEKALKSY